MARVTLATFNCENLFARFRFATLGDVDLFAIQRDGFMVDPKLFERFVPAERLLVGKAIAALDADFVGLQEIESLDALKLFNETLIAKPARFRYPFLIDGNDPRCIDVAALSRLPIDFMRTHQYVKSGAAPLFSRDVLEVHLTVAKGRNLPIFITHLKSMVGGRAQTKARRASQVKGLLKILQARFGEDFGAAEFVVLGDCNDYYDAARPAESGIRELCESPHLVNVVQRLPEAERWTHFFPEEKAKGYHQIDYLFLSRALAQKNANALPRIERRGQPLRVNLKNEPPRVAEFFPEIKGELKASDHCPVVITLEV